MSTKRLFVAYNHAKGTTQSGWGCTMIEIDTGVEIRSYQDLAVMAAHIKRSNPKLAYSNVFVTLFRVMPDVAPDENVNWMVTYTHTNQQGNQVTIGNGMLVATLKGPLDLDFVIDLIKRQGIVDPVVTNLQPLGQS